MKKILTISAILAALTMTANAGETFMGVTLNKPLDLHKWNCKQSTDNSKTCKQINGDSHVEVNTNNNNIVETIWYEPDRSKVGCSLSSPWVQKVKKTLESKYGQLHPLYNFAYKVHTKSTDITFTYDCGSGAPNIAYRYDPLESDIPSGI